ncbi:MAG: HAMP domain-containing histidine kinase [Deltaproteobacteria bacterium]|nr:HAMP domain-containing histidine kinase [Deltaproteobacteria bacterium]MBW2662287.1 HAMP domain-containing histidine kinase [Deltaproteobacteria bacterium]
MNELKRFFHPILILIFSIAALAMSLFLYIYWYIEVSVGLKKLVAELNLDSGQVLEPQAWMVILILSILVGIILMGIFIIFVYYQKTVRLYRMQRNFIDSFTHELKTPVTSLKLYLETFKKHELSRNDRLKYIGYMIQDVNRLSDNINRVLNLARIESRNYGGEFVISDLVQTVEQFIKNNIHLFKNCEFNIQNHSSGSILYYINQSLFEMLLMNLLTNAVKYNESDKPRIDISFEIKKHELYIIFTDNGIGLEKAEIKKIFRKFYQVGQLNNMSAMGSGFGLYLVRNIVRIHKGKVIAKSMGIGKGSTFSIILPYLG